MQSYNEKGSLTTSTFWRNGVLLAILDAAICFFFTYYSINTHGVNTTNDVYSVRQGGLHRPAGHRHLGGEAYRGLDGLLLDLNSPMPGGKLSDTELLGCQTGLLEGGPKYGLE